MAALHRLGLIALAVLLAWLWLPPGPAPWLVFVGDVPFLALLFFQDGRHWKRWALLYGFLFMLAAAHWLAYITTAHPFAAAAVMAPVFVLAGAAIRWGAARRIPFALVVGTVAVLEEMLRTVWVGGFPWPQRSLAFATDASLDLGMNALLPAASLFGAWTFSFVAGCIGGLVWGRVIDRGLPAADGARRRDVRAAAAGGGLLLVLVALAAVRGIDPDHAADDGAWGDGSSQVTTEREMLVVQAVIDQSLKRGTSAETKRMFDEHVRLSATGVRQVGAGNLLGVLWPETMIPWPFTDADIAHRFPEAWEDEVGVVRRIHDDVPLGRELPWFVGAIHHFRRGAERQVTLWDYGDHDSLFWIDPAEAPARGAPIPPQPPVGSPAPWMRGRHDKVRLVPGGEYTPGGDWFPPLEWFRRQISRFPALDAGALRQEPWTIDAGNERVRIGSAVCYDIAFAGPCRAWRRQGAQVLLNPGNYGWFGPTAFRSQLAAFARLRAAELAVTVVVAGNTGPSGFYDPDGRPYGTFVAEDGSRTTPAGQLATTYTPGFAHAPLRIVGGTTPYTDLGDHPWYLLAAFVTLAGIVRGRRRVSGSEDPA